MNHLPNAFQRFLHRILMLKPVSALLAHILQPADEFALYLTRGKHTFAELVGLPVIKLDTIGARTGLRRSHPLGGITDAGKCILIGSYFGNKHHPAWVHNLRAHPECVVHQHGRSGKYLARETDNEERAKYWQLALTYYKGYEAYEKRAAPRKISVWILEPMAASS
jgi:deazaflavin-dependent oxidoreductase (nitroreductase family)